MATRASASVRSLSLPTISEGELLQGEEALAKGSHLQHIPGRAVPAKSLLQRPSAARRRSKERRSTKNESFAGCWQNFWSHAQTQKHYHDQIRSAPGIRFSHTPLLCSV